MMFWCSHPQRKTMFTMCVKYLNVSWILISLCITQVPWVYSEWVGSQDGSIEGGSTDSVAQISHNRGTTVVSGWLQRFSNFYQQFIWGFSTVASVLMSLLIKILGRLKWTVAFNTLKERLMSSSVIYHPDPSILSVVEVDALAIVCIPDFQSSNTQWILASPLWIILV